MSEIVGEVGTKKLFENDRVVVWEMRLAPGEKELVHEHHNDYVMVQIAGDRVAAQVGRIASIHRQWMAGCNGHEVLVPSSCR